MSGLQAALWSESLKARKSKMFPGTLLFFVFIAVMMGLMMYAAQHPELAGRSATLAAKTSAIGKAEWYSFFSLLIQIILAMGPIGFGMVASWVFGREYSDRVAKDLLALPVSRLNMVVAKFIVIIIWCLLLSVVMFAASLLTGLAVGMPGWAEVSLARSFAVFAGSAFLTLLLCTPVALIASISRGYLLPIAFAILTLIVTNFVAIGAPGLMPYFPWGIPALFSGIAGSQALPQAGAVSYIILAATSILGFWGTAAWWRF